jgi:hypothetical protein
LLQRQIVPLPNVATNAPAMIYQHSNFPLFSPGTPLSANAIQAVFSAQAAPGQTPAIGYTSNHAQYHPERIHQAKRVTSGSGEVTFGNDGGAIGSDGDDSGSGGARDTSGGVAYSSGLDPND